MNRTDELDREFVEKFEEQVRKEEQLMPGGEARCVMAKISERKNPAAMLTGSVESDWEFVKSHLDAGP